MSRAPGSYAGLTAAQADLLSFVRKRTADGHSPSYEEMREACGLHSKSGVFRLVSALEERGYVTRHANKARSLVCSEHPRLAASTISTEVLLAEMRSRGFRFYGMSGERA